MLRRQCLRYLQGGGYGEAVNTADCGSVTRGFDPHYSPHNLHIVIIVGVSPSGKATDFDSVMRWFDPSHPCQHDSLAQLAEHLTFNQGVPRSSRGWVTNFGPLVKRLRHRPFTAVSRVRFPDGSPHGRLAQLGERLPYKQDVGSSILSSSTNASGYLRMAAFFVIVNNKYL